MNETCKPIHDLSQRVLSLARELDRLPPGDYSVRLVKPELAGLSWHAEIIRVEPIREMELPVRVVSATSAGA
jgi:hypothetical protein